MAPIYEALKAALVARGWTIDESQSDPALVEKRGGEVWEFVHLILAKSSPGLMPFLLKKNWR